MKPLFDRDIYEQFTKTKLSSAIDYVWIATANMKSTGLYFHGRFISFVDMMAAMVQRGVFFRIIHAELPSAPFRARYEELDINGSLSAGVEFLQCIRMHSKIFLIDGEYALVGSPNLTGAGIGAKSKRKRNFETAFLFEGPEETDIFTNYFDFVWMGGQCSDCAQKKLCPAPVL
jgi:phosphatidylserine/phosphatidylglycerophosphate/cardiolipin synthase-like enzyme